MSKGQACLVRYCAQKWVTWGYTRFPRSGRLVQAVLCVGHRNEAGIPPGEHAWIMEHDGTLVLSSQIKRDAA